ncbi:hypothetical protein HNP89_001507 [Methanococcus maripaludis]|uniref:Uncharacterized protein n=1 Tax=Methanococcus maripaludis TaxID=39152 RepID=A0A7J9P1W3_METMI|nr:hypothetical protein [Methanococcus maripaludis]
MGLFGKKYDENKLKYEKLNCRELKSLFTVLF